MSLNALGGGGCFPSASGPVLDQRPPDAQTLRLDESMDSVGDDDPFTAKLSFEVRAPVSDGLLRPPTPPGLAQVPFLHTLPPGPPGEGGGLPVTETASWVLPRDRTSRGGLGGPPAG